MTNKELKIWKFLSDKLSNEQACYLMVIVESKGSSPGRKGFKMAVCRDGELMGSVGGGSMEHRLVEQCRDLLQKGEKRIFQKKEVHHGNTDSPSGMICSGNQAVAFYPLNIENLQLIQRIVQTIEQQEKRLLQFNQQGFFLQEEGSEIKVDLHTVLPNEAWELNEIPGFKHEVYIVGGGHVSLALSQMLSILDFQVTVFDEREKLNTFDENDFAHEKKRINYKEVAQYIPDGTNIMVVIMTQFHTSDYLVLKQMIGKNLGYLGMMGSKSKVKTLFQKLKEEGVDAGWPQKVHAPIGIEISSQTPEEIAVSIAAELIGVKNQG
jgi:xanthine dehydrogenase accessory factor